MELSENYSHKTTTLQLLVKTEKGYPVCVVTMDAKNYSTRNKENYEYLIEKLTDYITRLYVEVN